MRLDGRLRKRPAVRLCFGVLLLLATLTAAGCDGMSCSAESSTTTPVPVPGHVSTSIVVWTTDETSMSTSTTTIGGTSTTTTAQPPTITAPSTTATTLGPLELYRTDMRRWKNTYASAMDENYQIISKMRNPFDPSPEEIQAALRLDAQLQDMVGELERIVPPPDLAHLHADYLASLRQLASGAHDLAVALEDGKGLRAVSAIATIATAWSDGAPARTSLEQALGFSLSSAD